MRYLHVLMVSGILSFELLGDPVWAALKQPNPKLTPGVVCTPLDPDFKAYTYPSQVARCHRNVQLSEKKQVAMEYGIPRSKWSQYEFDHLIPLCVGGSNDLGNLWPQPIVDARKKDGIENEVCLALQAGTMNQAQAVQRIWDWFAQN